MTPRLACALLVLWSAPTMAQEALRPDLSGTWTQGASILYVDHSDLRLWLTRAYVVDGKADLFRVIVDADGKDDVQEWKDHKIAKRCRWEGDRLVLEFRETERGKESVTVMKLSPSPDGKALTLEERFTSPDRSFENTVVLDRETTPPTLDVTEADLAEIKAAVLRHYATRKPGNIGEAWAEELRRGALFPADERRGPSIGIFELTLQDGRLALVRQPPFEPPLLVYFGFYLAKIEGRWVVLEDYVLEERISYVEEE